MKAVAIYRQMRRIVLDEGRHMRSRLAEFDGAIAQLDGTLMDQARGVALARTEADPVSVQFDRVQIPDCIVITRSFDWSADAGLHDYAAFRLAS